MAKSEDESRAKGTSDEASREELKKDPVGTPPESEELGDDEVESAQGGTSPPARIEGPTV